MKTKLRPLEVLGGYQVHDDTIVSLLRSRRAARPAAEALLFETRSWTYADLDRASDLLAAAIAGHGLRKGDRVALVAHNSDLSVILFLAAAKSGLVFVPINPALVANELEYILGHSGARLVVAQDADHERTAAIAATLKAKPAVLGTEALGAAAADWAGVIDALSALDGARAQPPAVAVAADDPAVIIYTSGTTGFPKGVLHSHRNYVWAAEAFVERMHLQPTDRLLSILPFFHINALFYSLGGALAAGGTLITTARFSASQFWDFAARCGATELNILAAVGNILAKRPRSEFNPQHRIRKIYGGPISAEMIRVFQDEFNVPDLIEGYGMSEIPGACNNPFDGVRKVGSIGKPARHPRFDSSFAQMKVIDEAGRELPAGGIGELVVKTPIVMLGYFNAPQQTEGAYIDGWLRTGDLVRRDDDGYFYFVARKKDIIRRRGENVSGAELDRVLSNHPDIVEAAAIGVAAELGEEEIMAVVVRRGADGPTAEEVIAWCARHLAPMKVPRYVVFADTLPHTSSHRVAKFRLKDDRTLLARAFDRERAVKNT